MILLLDTSTKLCRLTLVDGDRRYEDEWLAERNLAHGLLSYLHDKLAENNKDWSDISGIGAFLGPGSFTGLRIGLTVLNTIADSENIPIVGSKNDDWQSELIDRLKKGDSDGILLPYYGASAHITKPRK